MVRSQSVLIDRTDMYPTFLLVLPLHPQSREYWFLEKIQRILEELTGPMGIWSALSIICIGLALFAAARNASLTSGVTCAVAVAILRHPIGHYGRERRGIVWTAAEEFGFSVAIAFLMIGVFVVFRMINRRR